MQTATLRASNSTSSACAALSGSSAPRSNSRVSMPWYICTPHQSQVDISDLHAMSVLISPLTLQLTNGDLEAVTRLQLAQWKQYVWSHGSLPDVQAQSVKALLCGEAKRATRLFTSTFLAMSLKVISRACSQVKGSPRTLLTNADRLSK